MKIVSPLHDDPWFPRHFLLLFFLFFYFKKDVIFSRTLSGSRENGEGGAEVSHELPPLHKPRLPVAGRLPVTTFFTKNEPASTRHHDACFTSEFALGAAHFMAFHGSVTACVH